MVIIYSFSSRISSGWIVEVTVRGEIKKVQSCGSNYLLDKALMETPCQQQARCIGSTLPVTWFCSQYWMSWIHQHSILNSIQAHICYSPSAEFRVWFHLTVSLMLLQAVARMFHCSAPQCCALPPSFFVLEIVVLHDVLLAMEVSCWQEMKEQNHSVSSSFLILWGHCNVKLDP